MLRMLRVYWPSARMTPGSSFGPITISATTPMSRNSVQLMSNIKTLRPLAGAVADRREGSRALDLALGFGAPLDVGSRLMVDGLHRRVRLGSGFGAIVIGHALLEGFDALGDVAHHVRNLAAPAEHQQKDGADDQPMPDAQRTHEILQAHARGEIPILARN